jgi:hypothetical protein
MYINPHFGYSVDEMLHYIDSSSDFVLKPDAFPHDIKEYYWIHAGSPGKVAWYALGCLQEEGLYFFYKAYTHSTFDKDGHMELWISHRFSELIQYAMDTLTYTTYITDTQNKISDGSASDL